MFARSLACSWITLGFCSTLLAQAEWQRLTLPAPSPSARVYHSVAYDERAKQLLLFGGHPDWSSSSNETWSFDGQRWTLLNPATSPGPRGAAAMCYDRRRGRIVLFGGRTLAPFALYADLWEWDGTRWSQRTTAGGPSARIGAMMAYDSVRNVAVLFGGYDGNYLGDVWEWDGTTWTARTSTGPSPAPRAYGGFCFDSLRGNTVLYSGLDRYSTFDPAVWHWNGKAWSGPFLPNLRPGGFAALSMTFDELRGRAIYFGGYFTAVSGFWFERDSAEWDGIAWSNFVRRPASGPRASSAASLTWFPPANASILFGGYEGSTFYADTYACFTRHVPAVGRSGIGCPGTNGTPSLTQVDSALPWVGQTCNLQAGHLALGSGLSLAFGLLGDSSSRWGSLTLPLDLSAFGMNGCALYTNPLLTTPLLDTGGTASWAIPIPNDSSLAGRLVFLQVGTSSPGTNPAGVVLSDLTRLTIGMR